MGSKGLRWTVVMGLFALLVTWVSSQPEGYGAPRAGVASATPISGTIEDKAKLTPKERMALFEQATEQLYRSMQEGEGEQALKALGALNESMTELSFKGLTSVEGIHALAECSIDVRQAVVSIRPDHDEWARTSARLRLAVNSLAHRENALWLQYYKVMDADREAMEKGRIQGSGSQVQEGFHQLRSHYETIRPAAVIRKPAWEISRFDSWMSHLAQLSEAKNPDSAALRQALDQGDKLIKELFGKSDKPVFFPIAGYGKPVYWSLLIGGWIVLALGYSGLRQYWADQSLASVHGPKDRDDRFRL